MGSLRGAGAPVTSDGRSYRQKRLAEVADIAETIIKTLMGDDEEHLRDEFENDYQLDSDVETFENLTGKKIRPIISS